MYQHGSGYMPYLEGLLYVYTYPTTIEHPTRFRFVSIRHMRSSFATGLVLFPIYHPSVS